MCRVLKVHRSGFYAWLHEPNSIRAIEDKRLLSLIRESYDASESIYGSPRVFRDLREDGEACGIHRVARIMKENKIKAQRGYKAPSFKYGKVAVAAPNRLEQDFNVSAPNLVWVTDITYIRTWEGWLYLAVVVDLYSRMVVGWSMKPSLHRDIVLDALLMSVWNRRPETSVIVHSDQGSQYDSDDWKRLLNAHGMEPSMSRRGNCFDNAVAESFFSSLKKEKIRKQIFRTRDEAKTVIFDYIEVFYNRKRRHSYLGMISPLDYEKQSYFGT
mgnify:CR=1 FL=1|jgi:putative transposase